MDDDPRAQIVLLLNADRKSAQQRICRNLVLSVSVLADLSISGRHGLLYPYLYACLFKDKTPRHLDPSKINFDAVVNKKDTKAKQGLKIIFQYDKERRHVAAHFLYTPSGRNWHLFYFDQRDVDRHDNHCKLGAHIHYVSDLYCSLSADEAWDKAKSGDLNFKAKEHIRFSYSPEVGDGCGPEHETNISWPALLRRPE